MGLDGFCKLAYSTTATPTCRNIHRTKDMNPALVKTVKVLVKGLVHPYVIIRHHFLCVCCGDPSTNHYVHMLKIFARRMRLPQL